MSDSYWVRHQGRSLGPYALDRIRQMVRKGQVGRAQEVSLDGIAWAPATSFPEIFDRPAEPIAVVAQPAAVQASAAAPAVVTAPPSEPQWYCAVNGSQQGPMPRSQLVSLIRAGRLTEADLVFRDGMADWTLAGEVPEIAAAFGSPAGGPGGRTPGMDAFCRECGAAVNKKARMCPKCGAPTVIDDFPPPDVLRGGGININIRGEDLGGPRPAPSGDPKSKVVAAVLALMLGGLGVHHFYLGNATLGILYLLFCWTLIPAVISFVEAIVFLTMSDAAFDAKYN